MDQHDQADTNRHVTALRSMIASAFVAICALGCASSAPTSLPPPKAEGLYRVGASDQLTVRVLPDPAIERVVKVRPDGRFSFDLIGDVNASGRTTDEIEAEITERIAEYRQSPSVTIALEEPSSTAVSVLGEVNDPIVFPLERDIRLSEAIAQAGGSTELAAKSRVRIMRYSGAKPVTYLADLDAIQAGDGSTDLYIERGDLIFVPPATPVSAGYSIRRALYPVEVILQGVVGTILGLAIGGI